MRCEKSRYFRQTVRHYNEASSSSGGPYGCCPGARLGAYDVVSDLGAGTMSEVHRARDAKLGATWRSRWCPRPSRSIPITDPSQAFWSSMAQPFDGRPFGDDVTREADARPTDVPAAPSPTFAVDQLIAGRFRVARLIARGGMGEVYEAEDQTLRVRVALKTIRHEIAGDPMAMERFRREMLLARQVTHPNICRLFDVFVHRLDNGDEILFLTMELLNGRTLAEELVARGPMSETEALPLVRQLVSALDAAHGVGVVHRDFKTTNVMMIGGRGDSETRVVVTDFGLARGRLTGVTGDNSLTGVAAFLGTPAYMAPEQVMGGEASPASDIYALGIVLYETVTGVRPFSGDSPLSVATKRLQEAPISPRVLRPSLATRWEQVILKCLERRPEDRYATARDVKDALAETSRPALAAAPTRGRVAIALAIGVALLLGAFFATRWVRRPPRADAAATHSMTARKAVAVLGFRNLSGDEQTAWVSKALAEMLATELSTGGVLRTIPGENVARMKREFSLLDTDSLARDTLVRIRDSLGTDVVVLGSYVMLANGQIRLDLRMQDAAGGETLLAAAETGTESGLFDLVVRAGAALRRSLGVAELQAAEADTLKAAVPTTPDAQKLYSEGLEKLRLFDAAGARDLLERAIIADPGSTLVHSALSEAWARLGYQASARDEAKKAFELSAKLSRENRMLVEARYRAVTLDWAKAAELYRTLLALFPDNIEYGLQLAAALTAQQKASVTFGTLDALRKLDRVGGDPRIDLAEADAARAIEDFPRTLVASERAVTGATARGARLLLAQARQVQGTALANLGQPEKARASYMLARDGFAAAGDRGRVALTLNNLGTLEQETGNLAGARKSFEEALAVFREIGARRVEGMAMGNIANVAMDQGDLNVAVSGFRDALRIAREVGDRPAVGRNLNNLGVALWQLGDLPEARTTLIEALTAARASGSKNIEAVVLIGVGDLLLEQGRLAEAQSRYEEALTITRQTGSRRFAAFALFGFGNVRRQQDQLADARAKHEEALSIRNETRDANGQTESRLALARLALDESRPQDVDDLARQAAQGFKSQHLTCSEAEAKAVLATALISRGESSGAREAIGAAQAGSVRCQNPRVGIGVALTAARVEAVSGNLPSAVKAADAARTEARRSKIVPLELEAELVSAQVAARATNKTAAIARLRALEKRAAASGFVLIARQAREAGSKTSHFAKFSR